MQQHFERGAVLEVESRVSPYFAQGEDVVGQNGAAAKRGLEGRQAKRLIQRGGDVQAAGPKQRKQLRLVEEAQRLQRLRQGIQLRQSGAG